MKKLVFVTMLLFLSGVGFINLQANAKPVKEQNVEKISFKEPLWWSCEKWGMQQATNAGYTENTIPWYRAKNAYQKQCMQMCE